MMSFGKLFRYLFSAFGILCIAAGVLEIILYGLFGCDFFGLFGEPAEPVACPNSSAIGAGSISIVIGLIFYIVARKYKRRPRLLLFRTRKLSSLVAMVPAFTGRESS